MKKRVILLFFFAALFMFSFSGNLLAADTYNVTIKTGITPNTSYYQNTCQNIKVDIYDASNNKVSSIFTAGASTSYSQTKIKVAPGSYTYQGYSASTTKLVGSGRFDVTKDNQVITLKCVSFPTIASPADAYTNHVWNEDKSYEYQSGGDGMSFLLPAIGGDGHYFYAYAPEDSANYWGSNGDLYVYPTVNADVFSGMNLSDSGTFIVKSKVTMTVKIPHGATIDFYHMVRFYRPEEVMEKTLVSQEGDYDVYSVTAPNYSIHYVLHMNGKVTQARMVTPSLYTSTPLTISASELTADPTQVIRDSSQGYYDASLLMNINDSNYMTLNVGDYYDIRCYRNWEAISSITGNYYVDPDYHYTVAEGDSVTVDSNGRITAVKSGVSVIHVTYDALDWLSCDASDPIIYSASYPENTGVIVVNVGADKTTSITTSINRSSEYETLYYTKSINGVTQEKQYAEYTFTPKADDSISVRVQSPLQTNWNDGWQTYTANADGSYTVKLYDGRNILEVKSGNSVAYHVLRAYGLDLTITNTKTGAEIGDSVSIGSTLAITFNGVNCPLAKLGAVYNPGYPDGIYIVYDHDGQELEGTHTQYNLKTNNTLYVTCDESGTCTLTDGKIHCNVIGGGLTTHRSLTLGGCTGQSSTLGSDGNSSVSFDGYLCSLPDISINVVGEKDEAAEAALSYCKIDYVQKSNPSISLGDDSIAASAASETDDDLAQILTSSSNSSTNTYRALSYSVRPENATKVKMLLRYWTENSSTPKTMTVTPGQTATTTKFSRYDDVTYAELILMPDASTNAYNKTYSLRVSNAKETVGKTANPYYGNVSYLSGLSVVILDGLDQVSTLNGKLKADAATYTDNSGNTQTLDFGYGFLGTELNYSTTVPGTTSQIQIIPTALVEGAATPVVTVNGETVASGASSQIIDLDEGDNLITVKDTTGSDTKTYTVNVYREDAPRTVTFSGQSGMTVIAYDEDGTKYRQEDDGAMTLYPGDYTYYASCSGYLTKSGSFTVTKAENNTVAVGALTAVPAQQGSVSVHVTDDDAVLRDTTVSIASSPADLAKQKYVEYNNGGYTALHAIIDALNSGTTSIGFTCKKGNLMPDTTISATNQGDAAGWVCEVNGKTVEPVSTLVYAGDKVVFYYNADYDGMVHAAFTEKIKTVEAGSSGSFMLMATAVKNDGSLSTAVANAELYVNGKDSGVKTDANGKATLNVFPTAGKYIVTAVKKNAAGDNVLTYTYCTVTATKPSETTDTITVTFRLIGDTEHDNGTTDHEKYVNWIATRSYTFDAETVTVYDVFTRALDGAGLSYVGAEKNYVRNITAPISYGGYTIGEFDNGTFSGWMYTLNGDHPNWGLKEQAVADGDVIIWHYVDNYIEEAEDGASYPYRWLEADDKEPDYITANIAIYELADADDVTLRDKDAIAAARAAYDSLSTDEKGYISTERLSKLTADEAKLAELSAADQTAAQTVMNQIAALPDAKSLNLTHSTVVTAAREAYDGLTDAQKSLVTNYSTLTAAETALAALKESPITNVANMTDVSAKAWYYDYVNYVLAKGIMYGSSSTTFDPEGDITRGQFVTIIGRYAGIKDSTTSSTATTQFSDVTSSAYYAAHVAWAAANGITSGTSATTFDPNAKITRQDMAAMIARFAKVMKINLPDGSGATVFADDGDIAAYAKTAVYSMAEAKIINGVGNNTFSPKATATRGQAATIIRLLIAYAEK